MGKVWLGILLVVVVSLVAVSDEILDVYFIDVGHGDAILVKFGTDEWLIDTGYKKAWTSTSICSELLDVEIDLPVEYFILSHADLDHYSALDLFLCPCRIQTVSSSLDPSAAQVLADDVDQVSDCGSSPMATPSIDLLSADSPIAFAQSRLDWSVLHPTSNFAYSSASTNSKSVVLLLTYGNVSFLFPGDIESLNADTVAGWGLSGILILKAPHHGRANSATLALAEWLAPNLIVVSTGDRIPETAVAITQHGIPVFSTSTCGTIHVRTDGDSVWVTTDTITAQVVD